MYSLCGGLLTCVRVWLWLFGFRLLYFGLFRFVLVFWLVNFALSLLVFCDALLTLLNCGFADCFSFKFRFV